MFKVNNQDAVVLVSLMLTLIIFIPCSIVSIVNFEQTNASWVKKNTSIIEKHFFILDHTILLRLIFKR